jgi:hypothetical protein
MERVAEKTQTLSPPPGFSADRFIGQLDPIPRFLWNTPTAMHDLTEEDLESTIREWLDLEVIREVSFQAARKADSDSAAAVDHDAGTPNTDAQADAQANATVGDVTKGVSRLRSQVGVLRDSLEDAFGDLLKGGDGEQKKSRRKKEAFSDDQVEGKVKEALAGIKASDLIKEPANASIMIRRGPYLTRGSDA